MFIAIVFMCAACGGLWLHIQTKNQAVVDRRNAATRAQQQRSKPKPGSEPRPAAARSKPPFGRRQG